MQESGAQRFAPLTGLLFIVLAIASFATFGDDPPDPDKPLGEIVKFWTEDTDKLYASLFLPGPGLCRLSCSSGPSCTEPCARTARTSACRWQPSGAVLLLAGGLLFDGTVILTLLETAEDLDPASVQLLGALYENDYMPMAAGTMIVALSSGLAILRTGVLPKWLGWIAILLAVVDGDPGRVRRLPRHRRVDRHRRRGSHDARRQRHPGERLRPPPNPGWPRRSPRRGPPGGSAPRPRSPPARPAPGTLLDEHVPRLRDTGTPGRSRRTRPAPASPTPRSASLTAVISAAPGAVGLGRHEQRERRGAGLRLGVRERRLVGRDHARREGRWWSRPGSRSPTGRSGFFSAKSRHAMKPLLTRPVNRPVFMITRRSTRSAFSTAQRRPIGPPQSWTTTVAPREVEPVEHAA